MYSASEILLWLTLVRYYTQQTLSSWTWLYWVLLVLLVAFLAINLVLAVVVDTFSQNSRFTRWLAGETHVHSASDLTGR